MRMGDIQVCKSSLGCFMCEDYNEFPNQFHKHVRQKQIILKLLCAIKRKQYIQTL